MAELINLRTVRKRAKRREDSLRAASGRLVHGQPKSQRELEAARREKAQRDLDGHRIDKGGRP
jgi:hypothetical protein